MFAVSWSRLGFTALGNGFYSFVLAASTAAAPAGRYLTPIRQAKPETKIMPEAKRNASDAQVGALESSYVVNRYLRFRHACWRRMLKLSRDCRESMILSSQDPHLGQRIVLRD